MGRSCAFGPNSYLVKREEYCVKEDKLLLGKELRNCKKILFFSEFGRGYLRVWATRLRSSSYGVAGNLTTKRLC